jgi:D-alanyl-D-alanine carboxypeptidase
MGRKQGRLRRIVTAGLAAVVLMGLAACSPNADAVSKLPAQASGSLSKDVSTQLDAAVTAAMTRAGASGAIVGVWAPWAGSWTAAKGTTTPDGSTKMSTAMSFRISSNTKSMTCTVLLALAQAGKVKLDDKVATYLPRMIGLSTITLGQLCQNTSGVGDYKPGLGSQFVNNPTRQWVPMELLSDGLAEPPTAAPGTAFANSNTGFVLLGMALSAATGQSWNDLYQQYIWGPLNMDHTTLPDPGKLTLPSPHADGFATAVDGAGTPQCGTVLDETELSSSMAWTAGGVVSNLDDMKTYSQALAGGTLLDPEYSKKQWTTTRVSDKAPSWQGYGMGVTTLGPMRGNNGNIPGFITSTLSDPKSGLTVVVMLNNSTVGGGFAQELAMQLTSIASKAPAKSGKAPTIALPWSADQMAAAMASNTICPPKGVTPAAADPAVPIPQSAD